MLHPVKRLSLKKNNESALTGELIAVEKDTQPLAPDAPLTERTNMAYAGSFIMFRQGRGIVVAIGDATETGRISQLIEALQSKGEIVAMTGDRVNDAP